MLALGLLLLAGTIGVAIGTHTIYLAALIPGLLISCAGIQRIARPKRRRLSELLCLVLIVLATAAARFLPLLH